MLLGMPTCPYCKTPQPATRGREPVAATVICPKCGGRYGTGQLAGQADDQGDGGFADLPTAVLSPDVLREKLEATRRSEEALSQDVLFGGATVEVALPGDVNDRLEPWGEPSPSPSPVPARGSVPRPPPAPTLPSSHRVPRWVWLALAGALLGGGVGVALLSLREPTSVASEVRYANARVPLRRSPEIDAAIVVELGRGEQVRLYGQVGPFAVVRSVNDQLGYVPLTALDASPPAMDPVDALPPCEGRAPAETTESCVTRMAARLSDCATACASATTSVDCLVKCQDHVATCVRTCGDREEHAAAADEGGDPVQGDPVREEEARPEAREEVQEAVPPKPAAEVRPAAVPKRKPRARARDVKTHKGGTKTQWDVPADKPTDDGGWNLPP